LALVLTGLPAQEDTARNTGRLHLPQKLIALLQIDGPQRLRGNFLPTNVGRMFAGDEFKHMVAPVAKLFERVKEKAGVEVPIDIDALEEAIYAYGGRLTVAFYAEPEVLVSTEQTTPEFSLFLILSPDGKTDLPAFCKQCASLAAENLDDQLDNLEVLDQTLRIITAKHEDEPNVTLPFMLKDNAVVCIGTDLESSYRKLLNPDQEPTFEVHPTFQKASVGALINLRHVLDLIEGLVEDQLGELIFEGTGAKAAFQRSGLRSLETFEASLYPKGPNVVEDIVLSFNGQERGILAAVFPKGRERSPFLDVLPRDAATATTFYLDLPLAYKKVREIFADMEEGAPQERLDELEAAFAEMFGFRLYEDFLAHFGKHCIAVQRLSVDEEIDLGSADLSEILQSSAQGLCLGFQIKDTAKVNTNLQKMLRTRGLHAAQKKIDYKGYPVYSLSVVGLTRIHYAFSDRLVLVGVGVASAKTVRRVLDMEADRKAGKEPGPFPKGVQRRLDSAQPGWVDMSFTNVALTLKRNLQSVEALEDLGVLDDVEPGLADMFRSFGKLTDLLEKHNLGDKVRVSRIDGRRHVVRTIW
jgi:hypothetical protein